MNSLRLLGFIALLVALLGLPAKAQVLDPAFTPPTGLYAPGVVYTMGPQQADGKRLIGGIFSRINGTSVSNLARLDTSGVLDKAFSQNVGSVSSVRHITSLSNGQYLVSGFDSLFTASGLTRAGIVRLNANGTADASFDLGSGPNISKGDTTYISDYDVQPDGKIIAVGYFDTFSKTSASGIVRLNSNGSVDTSFKVGAGFDILNWFVPNAVLIQPDGKILVAGSFMNFDNKPASHLVRLMPDGSLDSSFTSSLDDYAKIYDLLLQPDGKLLVAGNSLIQGYFSYIIRLLPTGIVDTSFASTEMYDSELLHLGSRKKILAIQADGKLLFTSTHKLNNGSTIIRLKNNGSLDSTFVSQFTKGPSSQPYSISIQTNGKVIVGGNFESFNGIETPIGQVTDTGAPDISFAPTIQRAGIVTALVRQSNNSLVIGGDFSEINGQRVHRMARLSANGTLDMNFSSATGILPSSVTCLAQQFDGKILVGTQNGIFRFTSTGSPDISFSSRFHPTAMTLQVNGRALVGGYSNDTSGGRINSYLTRLRNDGSIDNTFSYRSNSYLGEMVTSIAALPDNHVIIAVSKFTPTRMPYVYLARYDSLGTLDSSFNDTLSFSDVNGSHGYSNRINAIIQQPDGKLVVGGNFGAVNSQYLSGVARLTATGAVDTSFQPSADIKGTVYSLALQPNGRVLLGGNFTSTGSAGTYTNLARMLPNGQLDASFANTAAPNNTVRTLLVQPDGAIVIAGDFTTVAGQQAAGVARLTAPNVLSVAAPNVVEVRTEAWPVPAHAVLHVAPDASAYPSTLELLDALSRVVRSQPVTATAAELSLSVEGLPVGVYLLRVTYATGTVTRRVAVQ